MKKRSPRSAAEPADPGAATLELPDWSGAVSEPRRLPWEVVYQRSLAALPFELAKPGFEERRLASKCREEFVL